MSRSVSYSSQPFARIVRSALLFMCASLPAMAWATHGGRTTIEVLGQDGDDKVYLLRHSKSGADDPPELLFFQLAQPGAQVQRSPAFDGDPRVNGSQKAHAIFAANLKALKARLVPLNEAPGAGWSAVTTAGGKEACPQAVWQARKCDVLDVKFTAAGQTVHRRFYAWPGPREVRSAWRLADGSVLFIYRYTGETIERGYAYDDAVLVRPAPLPTQALPWTQGCSKTECGVKVGSHYVIKTGPGLIKCVAEDGWLGCIHAPDASGYNQGWFVRLADGETTQFGAAQELETTGPEAERRDLSAPRWDKGFLVWLKYRYRRPPG